jgi:hypothetical protein
LPAAAVVLLLVSCNVGPINYDKFDSRTVEANLTAVDSAGMVYDALLSVGDINAACESARAYLLARPGVSRAGIAADSTVWAVFTSGLVAGCGPDADTMGVDSTGVEVSPDIRIQSGGEVGDFAHFIVPHASMIPASKWGAGCIGETLKVKLCGGKSDSVLDDKVTLGAARGAINPGTAVLWWFGHGALVWFKDGELNTPGITLGELFPLPEIAGSVIRTWGNLMHAGPDARHQVVVKRVGFGKYRLVILPEFVRANGQFDGNESQAANETKTIVSLGTCWGGYNADNPNSFIQAFRDVGADFVSGYDWAVTGPWAVENDIGVFSAMADTCFPKQALAYVGGELVDPVRHGPFHARYVWAGDTLVLLRTVFDAKRGGTLYRSCVGARAEMYTGQVTKFYVWERQDRSSDEAAYVTVQFPSTTPGSFDLFTSGAYVQWDDIVSGHTYSAQAGYVGTGGTFKVDACTDSLIVGHFFANLGWWDVGKNPYVDPPDDTFSLTDGVLKYSGKITRHGAEAALPGPVSAQPPAGF